jgi:hypothetical protein
VLPITQNIIQEMNVSGCLIMKVFCNPLNISYKFQLLKSGEKTIIDREAADPSVVLFHGHYYLFPSMSAGFWKSKDLHDWVYFPSPNLPIYDYAPDVHVIGEYLYFCASRRGRKCPILRTQNPESGQFEEVSRPFAFWDPTIFPDDDGRIYFYWGCSNKTPIWGIELDPQTMKPLGKKKALVYGKIQDHGWERTGENNVSQKPTSGSKLMALILGSKPFIEGAWITKHNGKYYLQYAAPGTEYNVYADGVYIADSPLGPFSYQRSNPVSMKPGGYITGAGHGSTFQDVYENWWHISTMRISVNHIFERRIGLFPAGFDQDGIFFCNTNYGDYPMDIPEKKIDPWNDMEPKWMLLSYKKNVVASSSLPDCDPEFAVDENIRTCWVANTAQKGEYLIVNLGKNADVWAIQANIAEYKLKLPLSEHNPVQGPFYMKRHIVTAPKYLKYTIEGSSDGETWKMLEDKSIHPTENPHEFFYYSSPHKIQYIKITGYEIPFNGHFAISGLRIFGESDGLPPSVPNVQTKRIDDLSAMIKWSICETATGYNIRYGISPEKLYLSWLIYDQDYIQ